VSYTVRFTPAAARDLQRLFDFLAVQDVKASRRARTAITGTPLAARVDYQRKVKRA